MKSESHAPDAAPRDRVIAALAAPPAPRRGTRPPGVKLADECVSLPGGVHICRGPATRKEYVGHQASARYCHRCRRRRVHELVAAVPVEPSYYGPTFRWECPCEVAS